MQVAFVWVGGEWGAGPWEDFKRQGGIVVMPKEQRCESPGSFWNQSLEQQHGGSSSTNLTLEGRAGLSGI